MNISKYAFVEKLEKYHNLLVENKNALSGAMQYAIWHYKFSLMLDGNTNHLHSLIKDFLI